ncbi:MAG: hypothetical protein WBB22_01725, partial [Anaerolineae bacterium]
MMEAQDTTDRAAEPLACPQCGKVDHVHKLSAIPDMPPEYGPPREPSSIDLAGVVPVALGTVFILVIPFTTGWMGMVGLYLIAWGAERFLSKQDQKARWEEAMSRWQRLYFCARDEVAFIPRGASAILLHRVQDSLYIDQE